MNGSDGKTSRSCNFPNRYRISVYYSILDIPIFPKQSGIVEFFKKQRKKPPFKCFPSGDRPFVCQTLRLQQSVVRRQDEAWPEESRLLIALMSGTKQLRGEHIYHQ